MKIQRYSIFILIFDILMNKCKTFQIILDLFHNISDNVWSELKQLKLMNAILQLEISFITDW